MNTEPYEREPLLIDWARLSTESGARPGSGISTKHALRGLELLLGEANCRTAVEQYVEGSAAAEFIRQVLSIVRPWSAMLSCHRIASGDLPDAPRATAVELLRSLADRRTLPWVDEYLSDPAEGVRYWAIGMIDSLISRGEVTREEALPRLQMAARRKDPKQLSAVADVSLRHFGVDGVARHGLPSEPGE